MPDQNEELAVEDVVEGFKRQISGQAEEIALLHAHLAKKNRQLQEFAAKIDELASSETRAPEKGQK